MLPNDPAATADALNRRFSQHSATAVMAHALKAPELGHVAMVSSFGTESVVLLHMISVTRPDTPILFVDTNLLFAETLVYQQELAERLNLSNVQVIRAETPTLASADPDHRLHLHDTDACCRLRKTAPLARALDGYDSWITGRKRYQGGERTVLPFFEAEAGTGRIKVNPLAHWAPEDLRTYIEENRLPRHPLIRHGYASVGCMPCTSPVTPGEDPRAGRWRGQEKTECGIHFINGRPVRTGELQ